MKSRASILDEEPCLHQNRNEKEKFKSKSGTPLETKIFAQLMQIVFSNYPSVLFLKAIFNCTFTKDLFISKKLKILKLAAEVFFSHERKI